MFFPELPNLDTQIRCVQNRKTAFQTDRKYPLPFKRQPHKIAKYTQTIRRQKPINCLSVFNHFVGMALKGLSDF